MLQILTYSLLALGCHKENDHRQRNEHRNHSSNGTGSLERSCKEMLNLDPRLLLNWFKWRKRARLMPWGTWNRLISSPSLRWHLIQSVCCFSLRVKSMLKRWKVWIVTWLSSPLLWSVRCKINSKHSIFLRYSKDSCLGLFLCCPEESCLDATRRLQDCHQPCRGKVHPTLHRGVIALPEPRS